MNAADRQRALWATLAALGILFYIAGRSRSTQLGQTVIIPASEPALHRWAEANGKMVLI